MVILSKINTDNMSVLHYVGLFQTYKLKLSMEQKHKVTLRHQKMHEQNKDENTGYP